MAPSGAPQKNAPFFYPPAPIFFILRAIWTSKMIYILFKKVHMSPKISACGGQIPYRKPLGQASRSSGFPQFCKDPGRNSFTANQAPHSQESVHNHTGCESLVSCDKHSFLQDKSTLGFRVEWVCCAAGAKIFGFYTQQKGG